MFHTSNKDISTRGIKSTIVILVSWLGLSTLIPANRIASGNSIPGERSIISPAALVGEKVFNDWFKEATHTLPVGPMSCHQYLSKKTERDPPARKACTHKLLFPVP